MMLRLLGSRLLPQRTLLAPSPVLPALQSAAWPLSRSSTTTTSIPQQQQQHASTTTRYFHASLPATLAIRRRRRQATAPTPTSSGYGNDNDGNSEVAQQDVSASRGLLRAAVTDPVEFLAGADALLIKMQEALEPMKRANEHFFVTRGTEEDVGDFLMIDVGPIHGQYTLQIDVEEQCLLFQSPISGQVTYYLAAATGEWCGQEDGHAFEGLLVRDLIRQCNGVPNL